MNVKIYALLRKINRYRKQRRKQRAGEIMAPVRRLECFAPPKQRVCAMTFDDGPTAAPCLPEHGRGGLTAHLLDVLKAHRATATFDVIGSTAGNYPDARGAPHSHHAFGIRFDHYADFRKDHLAGVEACPDLLKRLVSEGHEAANHSYAHRIFGPEYVIYRKRAFCRNIEAVAADLQKLHDMVKRLTGQEMKLARPPHYVDAIGRFGKMNAYDAYARMGYHYMAASVDGGGYMPTCGDYSRDVEAMVKPLRDVLERDPDGLSGAIIFQKDGYNMSLQSPVADALGLQLKLLAEYGYRVVTVGGLMALSPFEDVFHDDPCLEAVRGLEAAGYCLGFQNNTFKPSAPITEEQLDALCALRRDYPSRRISERAALTRDGIQRRIAARFGDCGPVSGNTRREAAVALWDAIQQGGKK
jgi:peptidoglycan/xylan/chitin deacetylase (PgdA/CDA1 family)